MSGARGPRIHPVVAGLIAGLAMGFVIFVMAKINVDFGPPQIPGLAGAHTLHVQASDADGISTSSDVRIDGRLVGQVTGVRAAAGFTDITIHVDNSEWPLPDGTTASIRLATLLGQKYVQLETTRADTPDGPGCPRDSRGTDTAVNMTTDGVCARFSNAAQPTYLKDNATIGPKSTKPVVDFDQILNQFDPPTRTHLVGIIQSASAGLQGTEGTVQQLLPDLSALSARSQVPLAELANRDAALNNILVHTATVADQLSASREDLAGVIDNLNSITQTLAQHQDVLRGFIVQTSQAAQAGHALFANGYAGKLGGNLIQLNTVVHDLNDLFQAAYPQTASFLAHGTQPVQSLVYEIGDAISQSDGDGFILRQNLQGVDFSGLGIGSTTGSTTSATQPPPPNSPNTAPAPGSSTTPPLPPVGTTPGCTVTLLGACIPAPGASPSPSSPPGTSPTPTPSPSPTPTPVCAIVCLGSDWAGAGSGTSLSSEPMIGGDWLLGSPV